MVMTIRAELDCHALKISLQQLAAGIPAPTWVLWLVPFAVR
jgi:hypothetical protein